jgi:WD repeat-containing protein 35
MNQTLEGHSGRVVCATWNPVFKKLTTSDENGLIIVWMLHKGVWWEEMINNRNKSVVRDMKWTVDGKKICIIYEDGAVIVGSVDGNRLWGKELNMTLKFVEWSPDGKYILFVTADSEVWVFDADGSKLRLLSLSAVEASLSGPFSITAIQWFSPPYNPKSYNFIVNSSDSYPSLLIAFDNGLILLSRGESDYDQIIFDTDLDITSCKWDSQGNILAVTGAVRSSRGEGKVVNLLKFYDAFGKFLRGIRIPGDNIAALSWEGSGLRISLAVDSFIFFANIRPSYVWTHLLNTIVYSYNRHDRKESTVIFWDLITLEAYSKVITNLKFLVACGDTCAVVWMERLEGANSKEIYHVQLRNAIGAVVDSKVIPFAPKHVSMGPLQFSATNDRTVFTWQFQSQATKSGLGNNIADITPQSSKVRLFDVENASLAAAQPPETFRMLTDPIQDRITCSALSDKFLVLGRRSGIVTRYILPHLSVENTFNIKCEPFKIQLNCTSSMLSVIDINGAFSIFDLEAKGNDEENDEDRVEGQQSQYCKRLKVDRKDVWDMRWADDNADMVCIMEKTKMVIFRGEQAEDPVVSSGYLARFKDLEIRAVSLDDLMQHPDQPSRECVVTFETRSLREIREKITMEGLAGGYAYANDNPHPRLWLLLAHSALEELDLSIAEYAFVRVMDYHGIQLVKQLRSMADKMKARAEVAVYLGKFDEAETIYREIDRKDLAIAMRNRIGDYSRVIQLLQSGGGNDMLLRDTYDKIGEYYADRLKWKKAAQYFQQSGNNVRLAEAYYRMQSFEELAQIMPNIPDGTPLLLTLAQYFESVGMHEEAVDCYVRGGNVKGAVDCCVTLNQWETALKLAEQYNYPQVEGLLNRFASELMTSGKKLLAVELYRRANRPTEAALLIGDIAEVAARKDLKPCFAKKLHVLAAFEIERHRKRATDSLITQAAGGMVAQATAATLDTLMMSTLDTQTTATGMKKASKAFSNAWRGAAAYHYFMLAQRQFYEGNFDAAMKTSIKLCEYDDILEARDIYRLLCLTSLRNKFYGICSKAFVKLETLPTLTDTERDDIQTLAVKIFINHAPSDPITLPEVYMHCLEMGKSYKACIVSGRYVDVYLL